MLHVIVHFDPTKVDQEFIDPLKINLPKIVAEALSYAPFMVQDPKEICVRQQVAHPTDVNPPAIEIEIQAGKARERDADKVVAQIISGVIRIQLFPTYFLEMEDLCVWLRFSENNGFALFNPKD